MYKWIHVNEPDDGDDDEDEAENEFEDVDYRMHTSVIVGL